LFTGEEIEVFGPGKEHFTQKIEQMWNDEGKEIDVAPHAQMIIKMKMLKDVERFYLLRKGRED
jgi:putative protease